MPKSARIAVASIEIVLTGDGDDTITGTGQSERFSAGGGDDYIADGGGRDTVDAGAGDDTVVASLDAAADNYDGGAGTDTLDYSETRSGVLIDLKEQTATGIEIGTDTDKRLRGYHRRRRGRPFCHHRSGRCRYRVAQETTFSSSRP